MARRIGAKREHSSSPVSRAALLLCNLVLIVGMIVAAVIYSRGITQQRYNIKKDAFCTAVESMKQVSENYFITEKGYVNNWSHYISTQHMTEDEALQFISTDDGIGMSEEFQKTMYTSFSRATDSRINKIQGSGLGLAIARQMTELMGGEIQCESALGRGTTFRVVFDLPTVAMTADAFAEDVAACREAGMDAHIAKPVDIKQVLRTLKLAREGTLHEQKKS